MVAVCHLFGLLSTDLHLIPCAFSVKISRASSSCSSSARASVSIVNISAAYANLAIMFETSDMIHLRKILKRLGDLYTLAIICVWVACFLEIT